MKFPLLGTVCSFSAAMLLAQEPAALLIEPLQENVDPGDPGLLPELGEIPELTPMEQAWDLSDEPLVDPALMERRRFSLPAAATLLPPKALRPESRIYQKVGFKGNRAFSNKTLAAIAGDPTAAAIDIEGRGILADSITRHYIAHGYINSGAVVPEPDPGSDELVVEITEGRLVEVALDRAPRDENFPVPADDCLTCILSGERTLRASYLRARVMGNPNKALNFPELQQRLQVLQLNPNIKRLQAELRPGLLPGEARVDLMVEEIPAWSYGLEIHNQLPPSVGAEQLDLWLENRNLTGFSDSLSLRYGVFGGGIDETQSAGADNVRLLYSLPVLRDDTTVDLFYDRQGYAIIEEPFTDLDISGSTWNAGLGVRRPIVRDVQDDLRWGISFARTHSETELLDEPFSISPGYVDGELDLTLLTFSLDWLRRTERQVITNHTELAAGLDTFGATSSNADPDSSFLAIRSNASYLARINEKGHLLYLRASAQWADDLLPSPEQWTLGGYSSVRGYRQNELVRDAGAAASMEYRIPFWSDKQSAATFVTFLDGGLAMDHDSKHAESLFSMGIGLTGNYRSWLRGEIFWGIPLSNHTDADDNLQDYGIHFRLTAGKF